VLERFRSVFGALGHFWTESAGALERWSVFGVFGHFWRESAVTFLERRSVGAFLESEHRSVSGALGCFWGECWIVFGV
jgi:hypothetical protein